MCYLGLLVLVVLINHIYGLLNFAKNQVAMAVVGLFKKY